MSGWFDTRILLKLLISPLPLRLSIEDPFEVGYDVAHVIKEDAHVSLTSSATENVSLVWIVTPPSNHLCVQRAITLEFARAYSILASTLTSSGGNFMDTFNAICEPASEPPVKIIRVIRKEKEGEDVEGDGEA